MVKIRITLLLVDFFISFPPFIFIAFPSVCGLPGWAGVPGWLTCLLLAVLGLDDQCSKSRKAGEAPELYRRRPVRPRLTTNTKRQPHEKKTRHMD